MCDTPSSSFQLSRIKSRSTPQNPGIIGSVNRDPSIGVRTQSPSEGPDRRELKQQTADIICNFNTFSLSAQINMLLHNGAVLSAFLLGLAKRCKKSESFVARRDWVGPVVPGRRAKGRLVERV